MALMNHRQHYSFPAVLLYMQRIFNCKLPVEKSQLVFYLRPQYYETINFNIIFLFAVCGFAQAKILNQSCDLIRAFVDGHNLRRHQLAKGQVSGQPPASGMKVMVWDEELAAKAAKWAAKNHFTHNPDRTIGSRRFTTGENLYYIGTTKRNYKLDIDSCLKSWFDEYNHYNYGPFHGSSKYMIGHYTQMAWANTMYVGCAVSQYENNNMKKYLVVCNYGPGGNYSDQKPYETRKGNNTLIRGIDDCSKPYGDRC